MLTLSVMASAVVVVVVALALRKNAAERAEAKRFAREHAETMAGLKRNRERLGC
jgi:hypothetical protein